MKTDPPVIDPRIETHPILRILAAFPIACFTCALGTDLAYTQTADMMWADFSTWLLAVGLAMAVLTAIAGFVTYLANRRVRARGVPWALVFGSLVIMALGLLNNLYHSRDAWTSVVPEGVGLSALTVVVILITAWASSTRRYRPAATTQYAGTRQ